MAFIFWIFTFLILIAPLPFGMVHEVIQAFFACCIFFLIGVLCLYYAQKSSAPVVPIRRITRETTAFALVLGWGLVQILPVTSPALHHPLWAEAGQALDRELSGAISLSPGSGFQALIRMATYGGVFWIALQLGRDRHRARRLIDFLILAGTLYAVYGMIMEFDGIKKILWLKKQSSVGWVSGTFVNRNNFATYTGLVLLCASGAYLTDFMELAGQGRRGRDRLVAFWNTALVQGAPRLASILILVSALFLSGSRGGISASMISLSIFLILYATIQSTRRRFTGFVAGVLIATLISTAAISGDQFFWRLISTDIEHEHRLIFYEQVQKAIAGSPFTGFGIGSFERTFPLYSDIMASQLDRAHNDWLEMIFELGWPAALLWFAILASLTLRCLAGFFRRERDHFYPLAGFCAALLAGLHAFVDFSLQVPAVAVTFATLLGVGIAQSRSSRG